MTAFNTFQRAKLAPIVVEMPLKTRNVPALHGPNPEPTPDPSPQSTSPVLLIEPPVREKRRFAPQLIETSRRARRTGDVGPRVADQTDVTPYTRDKYKGRKRQGEVKSRAGYGLSRTGSEDDCLLGRAAKKAERQMQEAVLAAFPNSRARAGGATHFYFRESGSDTSPESRSPPRSRLQAEQLCRQRRRSSTDLGWWQKLHREHSEQLARDQDEIIMPKPIRPFAQLEQNCDADPELSVMRRAASPPMLGDDIVFRMCESPEPAKIHTDLPWTAAEDEEKCRDQTQKQGLWKGFCYKAGGAGVDDSTVKCGLWGPKMIATPQPPATPHQDSFHALGNNPMASVLSPPPTPGVDSLWRGGAPSPRSVGTPNLSPFQVPVCKPCPRVQTAPEVAVNGDAKEDLEKRIASEFDDAFVTKVYNYLSFGYPVSAQTYDDELSKITGMGNGEIRRDDERNLRKGHVCDDVVARTPEERQCPRWRALKAYIHEWARQHPDLDGQDPSPKAWGIKNRGGWGS